MNARWRASIAAVLLGTAASPVGAEPETTPATPPPAAADAGAGRVWEINGIRLERNQVNRLAEDLAQRTLEAVVTKVEGIELRPEQRTAMREIYRTVSLDVFDVVVATVERTDLSDDQKDAEVRRLVLEGQKRSHGQLERVLDPAQMALYTRWEDKQVDAFQSRRWDRRGGRRRTP